MINSYVSNTDHKKIKQDIIYYQLSHDGAPPYSEKNQTHKDLSDKSVKRCYRILLVEDDPISQKVQKVLLEMQGYHVDAVYSGEEALAVFTKGYDLIILDIGLPGISGIETARAIRKSENGHKIPIIGLTAHGNTIVETCIKAGFNEVAHKPLADYMTLSKTIMKYLL